MSPLEDIDSPLDADAKAVHGLTPEEKRKRIHEATTSVLQLTNRLLTGDPDQVTMGVVNADHPAGWTTGEIIYINYHHLEPGTDEERAALWGLNYHELGHVLLTPRSRGDLRDRGRMQWWATAFNIMEDWRVESQFAALFTSAERYFDLMFKMLLANFKPHVADGHVRIFPLSCGRYYLDPLLRKRYELLFTRHLTGHTPRDFQPPALLELVKGTPHEGLLDTPMPEWTQRMQALADAYVQRFWSKSSKDSQARNRELIDMVDQFMVLTPWELIDDDTPLGVPTPGAGSSGYTGAGQDMPTKGQKNDDLELETTEAMLDVIARDQEERERIDEELRKLGIDPETGLPKVEEGQPETADPQGPPEDIDGSENAWGHAPDPDDPGGDPGDDDGDGGATGGEQGTATDDGSVGEQGCSRPIVRIDPSQAAADPDDDDGTPGSEQGRDAGILTGTAGAGTWGDAPGWDPVQLTDEQRAMVERVFCTEKEHDHLMTEEVRDILASKEVQRGSRAIRHAIAEATGEGIHLDPKAVGKTRAAPPTMLVERNRFARQLLEVRAALEGGWVGGQRSGKINVRRWATAASPAARLDSFEVYLPDQTEEAGIEAAICVDRSSSMASVADYASQMMWMVGSAIQRAEGFVTEIGFADVDKTEVLAGRDTRLRRSHYQSYETYGSTHAADACSRARKVLAASPMPNRLFAIITDAGWSDVGEAVRHIRKMNADGVDTLLILLGMHLERSRRGCKYVVHANDITQVGGELKRFVRRMQLEAARRVIAARGIMVE